MKGLSRIPFLLLFLTILYFLTSCSSSRIYSFNAKRFYLQEEDKKYQLDSFKVVKVIDNRKNKDSLIGKATTSKPLLINRELGEFLDEAFTSLISKDTSLEYYTPVTIYINNFFSN